MMWRLSFSQQTAIWLLAAAFLVGTGIRVFQAQRPVPVALENQVFPDSAEAIAFRERAAEVGRLADEMAHRPININTANRAELESLPGIGPVLAQRIIDYRESHGPFASVEAIDDVPGIGPKRLETMRDRITVDSTSAESGE
jgi:competence protein ComEA